MFTENPLWLEKLKYKKLRVTKLRSKTNYTIPRSVQMKFYSDWPVYKVYYLLAKNSKVDGRGGLKERGFLHLKRKGILERGKIEDLRQFAFLLNIKLK